MSEKILKIFKDDIWKDKRIIDPQKKNVFVKNSENANEKNTEVSVIEFLHSKGIDGIPKILKVTKSAIHLDCFRGMRVFELAVQLDELFIQKGLTKALEVKRLIIDRCAERQRIIQKALIEWRVTQKKKREPYPYFKLYSIIEVLAYCAGIRYDTKKAGEEIEKLNSYWANFVNVPFRDATIKNMVFCCDQLSRIEINPSEDKTQKERDIIESRLNDEEFWRYTPIGDFDFSTCIHDTTLEDDLISVRFHERPFDGNVFVDPEDLIWFGEPNAFRAAITFYVRYYRFGGRKAAYRLLNPINHRVRFRYDDDSFYFSRLNTIMRNLCKDVDDEFPQLMEITDKLSNNLGTQRAKTDLFYEMFPDAKRETWDGMASVPGKK